jgi:hypothetical protein
MARSRTQNGTGNKSHGSARTEDDEFRVKVTNRFVVLCLMSCTLLAYAVGRTARTLLIDGPQGRLLASLELQQSNNVMNDRVMKLPNPVLKNKPIPNTIYTSMNFDTARSSTINSRWVVMEGHETQEKEAPASNETCDASSDESHAGNARRRRRRTFAGGAAFVDGHSQRRFGLFGVGRAFGDSHVGCGGRLRSDSPFVSLSRAPTQRRFLRRSSSRKVS